MMPHESVTRSEGEIIVTTINKYDRPLDDREPYDGFKDSHNMEERAGFAGHSCAQVGRTVPRMKNVNTTTAAVFIEPSRSPQKSSIYVAS
jgi:hypothetical protein